MKTIFRLCALATLSALTLAPLIRADEPASIPAADEHARPDRAEMRARRLQQLDEKLKLTDAQKQQIQAIWAASEQQGKALHKDESLSKEDRRAKMREIMKANRAQVRAVLTPDQQTTFDAMPKPEMRGHGGHHKGDADKAADETPKQ